MEYYDLGQDIEYNNSHPIAKSIHADKDFRVLQFALNPGQEVKEHHSPSYSVLISILKGVGEFKSGDGSKVMGKPGMLIRYNKNENHSIQAHDEEGRDHYFKMEEC